jgi:hypothetical protein
VQVFPDHQIQESFSSFPTIGWRNREEQEAGLPDGLFSNQDIIFWYFGWS